MKTFEVELGNEWALILSSGEFVAFDVLSAVNVEVCFTDDAMPPSEELNGNGVSSWPQGWDFAISGLDPVLDRVWVRGSGIIRGIK